MSNSPPIINSLTLNCDIPTDDTEWQLLFAISLIESTLATLDLACLTCDQGKTFESKLILKNLKTQLTQFVMEVGPEQHLN